MRWLARLSPRSANTAVATASVAFESFRQWQDYCSANAKLLREQHGERLAMRDSQSREHVATCNCCGRRVAFPLPWVGTGLAMNLREWLVCPRCRLNARQRAALGLLRDSTPDRDARVYLTEQVSYAYVWTRRRYRRTCGGEFHVDPANRIALPLWLIRHGVLEKVRERDVTALDFADASLDAIASMDVLEHVPDYPRALREFARCLKPGGHLLMTLPFIEANAETLVRARLSADGTIEHLEPAEIHGDPLSGGVLCYYHFGWDLLDAVRAAGFASAAWRRSWAAEQGLFGAWTLVARR